ncbi:hypothetical protein [Glycomyces artemisiae]|uniref:PH (Pleckstrin Homology) domain-containing protein n=1 Tax=Glycomyces artemisiae TaxID=1076443 RepID=A0A2T0UWM0_9ACTN|nr:hypothetical protein [Glycomyces artemisiae]PRY62248.1 hypothetical protein B0I28_101576 [Glycomyces artemisiae]
MQPDTPHDHRVQVRYKPVAPSVVVFGGLLVMGGGVTLVFGLGNPGAIGFLFAGAFFITLGVFQFIKPYCVFDPASGELRIINILGFKNSVYGAPAGERLYAYGREIIRVLPDGAHATVRTGPGRKADFDRVLALLPPYRI